MNALRAGHGRPSPRSMAEGIDPSLAAKGASRGFTILVLGGLSVPLAAAASPALGSVWLTASSLVAFVVAAWNADGCPAPVRQGALNATCGYLLVLPLVLMASYEPSVVQIAATALAAVAVGGLAGWFRGRRTSPSRRREWRRRLEP